MDHEEMEDSDVEEEHEWSGRHAPEGMAHEALSDSDGEEEEAVAPAVIPGEARSA